ncbi:MAG: hypothetical protein LUP96_04900 [Methylococcaceae bacterium]|nr:hypothetical protein [Methylococcaceae bacterium]MDD1615316.1 hypothetical protein [Methylococcaceae bacterium]OYV20638.1 MAG: hypothetical protein CG439_382 [Methylococcaceae bacterium NSP1-2]
MKILIMLLLVSMSSVVMANGYYELSAAEQWQDYPKSNSYSDTRYRIQYTPAQIQGFVDQRNAEIAKRNQAELEKKIAHYNEMQQYYAAQRASLQFIGELE